MKILVTGVAGFIGSHLTEKLLAGGYEVIGIDNFNDYYNPKIKEENLSEVKKNKNFKLYREDILNFEELNNIFQKEKPQKIVHLAARAGVRPSIKNPLFYTRVNVLGTVNLLKLSVDFGIKQFIFGSSSSVYGNSRKIPFRENDLCDKIISPYGASKKAAEFWVESFCKTYGLKSIILRLFTVYGPSSRPDMAPALFTKAILEGKVINQFGDGLSSRDYTYIDDITNGVIKTLESNLNFEIINLGNNQPVTLADFIKTIGKITGKKARVRKLLAQPGDVDETWASIDKAKKLLKWFPSVSIETGLSKYINWYKKNHF